MLDFEKMKAALEAEKKRLETIIKTQEKLIPYMEKFDKKMFNKRIVDYIDEMQEVHSYIENRYDDKRLVIYIKNLPYNYNTIFWSVQENICDDKRFSHDKFKAELLKIMNNNLSNLAAVESDLADGEKRAQEFNYVQQYYIKLAKDFSYFIRNKYDHDFKIGWIG